MFITWVEGDKREKGLDPKGQACLENPAENFMAFRDFCVVFELSHVTDNGVMSIQWFL